MDPHPHSTRTSQKKQFSDLSQFSLDLCWTAGLALCLRPPEKGVAVSLLLAQGKGWTFVTDWQNRHVIFMQRKQSESFHSEAPASLPWLLCAGLTKLIVDWLPNKKNLVTISLNQSFASSIWFSHINCDSRIFFLRPDSSMWALLRCTGAS